MHLFVFVVFAILNIAFARPELPTGSRFIAENDVILNLYTRKNPTTGQVLKNGDVENLLDSNFDSSKPLKVFSHGWTNQAANPSLVQAFLAAGDCNVVLVDWTAGTGGEEEGVVANAPLVGIFVASFLDWLSTFGLNFNQIHIVGHSLGCHVTGWAGRSCRNGTVEIVTALDPSRKFWEDSPNKVNAGDGKYVEVIHTNTAYHALILPTGTADFYPNGGSDQPGCNSNNNCDHGRAMDFFVDSLDHQGFVARQCNSYDEIANGTCANIGTSYMGGTGAAKNASGVYYLTTNAAKPYYQG